MTTQFKPAKETPFVIETGKFYHTIFYMDFPPMEDHILGGNVTGLLWRFEDEPNAWRISYRFRYYKGTQINANESKDEFSWYSMHIDGTRIPADRVIEKFISVLTMASVMQFQTDVQVHRLVIMGDDQRFLHIVQNEPPFWMHPRPAEPHEQRS